MAVLNRQLRQMVEALLEPRLYEMSLERTAIDPSGTREGVLRRPRLQIPDKLHKCQSDNYLRPVCPVLIAQPSENSLQHLSLPEIGGRQQSYYTYLTPVVHIKHYVSIKRSRLYSYSLKLLAYESG